eukprot:GEMP01049304.1.p1 GENE.GEMP01049304.1~~GEMP01049304.1.p1  ORF type:complete len:394 (+),score=90.46 GEMP01049304.1:179-1360(+)
MDDYNPQYRPRVPHFSLSTVAQSAPGYSNAEQDIIRQAFHTGNYTWMKELLPVELAPDAINILRRRRMEENRVGTGRPPLTWSKMTGLWGGGFYQEFEYMPDPYELKENAISQEKKAGLEKRVEMGHSQDWHVPSQQARLKYEPMLVTREELKDVRTKETDFYLRPDSSEVEASASDSLMDNMEEPMFSFRVGKGQGLNDDGKMSRAGMQPKIKQWLQEKMDTDWDDATVVVSFTDQDMVQIAFYMGSVDSERGVLAYMNILAKNDDLVNSLGLRKLSQLWGVTRTFPKKPDDSIASEGDSADMKWMFFLMCPKWVRMRTTDAYYTRHPRAQGSQFRMSKAGSSVLFSLGTTSGEEPQQSLSIKEEEDDMSKMPDIDMLTTALEKTQQDKQDE